MSKEIENPPAFPVAVPYERINSYNEKVTDFNVSEGMTLRDYFAAKAMQGHIASLYEVLSGGTSNDEVLAAKYYSIADAMLKERSK